MPKSRLRKNHKTKVAARNKKIAQSKKTYEKAMTAYMEEIQKQVLAQKESENDAVSDAVNDAVNDAVIDIDVEIVTDETITTETKEK